MQRRDEVVARGGRINPHREKRSEEEIEGGGGPPRGTIEVVCSSRSPRSVL